MSETGRQVFLRKVAERRSDKTGFPLLEAVSECYEKSVRDAPSCFSRYELARKRLVFYKHKVMADLADYLMAFESAMTKAGAKVLYAENAMEAFKELMRLIAPASGSQNLFVSKDRLVEEVDLFNLFKDGGIKFSNTHLSDFPYPLLPFSSSELLKQIAKKLHMEEENPGEKGISLYKRHLLDAAFKDAVYISGADFLVADPGAVVMIEDDGTHALFSSFCQKHVILAGIDQMVPSINELDYFTSLVSAHRHASLQTWNQTLIFGPKTLEESDGPSELHIILVDNGRSKILKEEYQRSVFNCVHCDACTVLCPVAKHVNSSKEKLFSPVDCVLKPITDGFEKSGFMAFACTLCGKCSQVCPAMIDFEEIILYNRKKSSETEAFMSISRQQMKILRKMMLKQKVLNSAYHRFFLKVGFKRAFGNQKEFPDFGKKSFRLLWNEKNAMH